MSIAIMPKKKPTTDGRRARYEPLPAKDVAGFFYWCPAHGMVSTEHGGLVMFHRTLHDKRTVAVFSPQWTALQAPPVPSSDFQRCVSHCEFPGNGVVFDPPNRATSRSSSEISKTTVKVCRNG